MLKQKVFISGCGGMLGKAFYNEFKNHYSLICTDIDINEPWLTYQDFRDYEHYRLTVKDSNPDILIHLGAHTDLEYCENNIEDAYLTNTISVENATLIANELNIPLVYISTAGIFDGSKDLFDDWDTPNPMCVYARTKFLGEQFVQKNCNKHFIFRAGWMMGGYEKDKKFVFKIVKQIQEGKKILNIVNDKNGTPTYTLDFAKNVRMVIEKNLFGTYNLVCKGITSRLEVTKEIINILGKEKEIKINEVDSEFFQKTYFAKRPDSERLINRKLELRKLNLMRDWKEALAEYLNIYLTKNK